MCEVHHSSVNMNTFTYKMGHCYCQTLQNFISLKTLFSSKLHLLPVLNGLPVQPTCQCGIYAGFYGIMASFHLNALFNKFISEHFFIKDVCSMEAHKTWNKSMFTLYNKQP